MNERKDAVQTGTIAKHPDPLLPFFPTLDASLKTVRWSASCGAVVPLRTPTSSVAPTQTSIHDLFTCRVSIKVNMVLNVHRNHKAY